MLLGLAACQQDTAATSGAFYSWDDRKVHCAINIDTSARNDIESVKAGLDRAVARNEVLELYAHAPGGTISMADLEAVLVAVDARSSEGLMWVRYADVAIPGDPRPGVMLSFDDAYVDDWLAASDLLARHGAIVTFFVSYFDRLSPSAREGLHTLASRGHAIEAHSMRHQRAPSYVENHGLAAYIEDEALPSIDALRRDGFDVTTYAYPFGARTAELDRALLEHVSLVRSVSFTWTTLVADPCPD